MQNRTAAHIDFWTGILMGTMAGMAIAACTYSIADPILKALKGNAPSNAKVATMDLSRLGPKAAV